MKNDDLGLALVASGILFLILGIVVSVVVLTPRIDTHTQTRTVLVDDFKYHDGMLVYNNTEFHHIKSMSVANGSNSTVALTYTTSTTVTDSSVSQQVFGIFVVMAVSTEVVGFVVMHRKEDE